MHEAGNPVRAASCYAKAIAIVPPDVCTGRQGWQPSDEAVIWCCDLPTLDRIFFFFVS
jgi:hypothetical protein